MLTSVISIRLAATSSRNLKITHLFTEPALSYGVLAFGSCYRPQKRSASNSDIACSKGQSLVPCQRCRDGSSKEPRYLRPYHRGVIKCDCS